MVKGSVFDVVGQTPLIRIGSLSRRTGCEIFGKAEFLNPGGSVKDRAAREIIQEAEEQGHLQSGGLIVEGTAGNTGIGLATLAPSRGYRCLIVMPNNQALEKYQTLEALGVELIKVAPCPFSDENHFYHTARRLATERQGFWANQFENLASFRAHYRTTGPEIWEQMGGQVEAFISSSGTGGTLAGVSCYLKEKNPKVHIRLADPMGSGLHSYLQTGRLAASGSSITEGIGIMRLTANFQKARIDDSVQIDDQQMISMLHHLAREEGLLVGTSSALNLYAAYLYAQENRGSGKRIVTILCDSALRYQSKVFNPDFLREKGLRLDPLVEKAEHSGGV